MIPTYDVEELRALQLERLRDTLTRVHAHVPHYRHAFDRAGVHPSEVTSLADLAGLDPAIPLKRPRSCFIYRDHRVTRLRPGPVMTS
jgi:hypothetical protein